jgi:UDP-N-acetylglucosamine 3-dehydrogenase
MLRLGIIGCGRVTTMFHLKAIDEVVEVEVAAVADIDRERMEEVKRRSGADRSYTEYRELLSDPGVQAVAVNTPPHFHEEMTLDALGTGKHVLCEKPLAQSVEGCLRIKGAQEVAGKVAMPVHNYAFTPCLETAKELIRKDEIGEISRVGMRFDNNLWSYGAKTDFRLKERNSIVEDILPHVLSVAHELVGPEIAVEEAKGWAKRYEVIDNLSVALDAGGSVRLDCSMNWTSLIPGFTVEVVGDAGRMDMDLMKHPYRVSVKSKEGGRVIDKKGLKKYIDIVRMRHPAFREQYAHFARAVEGSEAPRFTVDDEVGMMGVMVDVVDRLPLDYRSSKE